MREMATTPTTDVVASRTCRRTQVPVGAADGDAGGRDPDHEQGDEARGVRRLGRQVAPTDDPRAGQVHLARERLHGAGQARPRPRSGSGSCGRGSRGSPGRGSADRSAVGATSRRAPTALQASGRPGPGRRPRGRSGGARQRRPHRHAPAPVRPRSAGSRRGSGCSTSRRGPPRQVTSPHLRARPRAGAGRSGTGRRRATGSTARRRTAGPLARTITTIGEPQQHHERGATPPPGEPQDHADGDEVDRRRAHHQPVRRATEQDVDRVHRQPERRARMRSLVLRGCRAVPPPRPAGGGCQKPLMWSSAWAMSPAGYQWGWRSTIEADDHRDGGQRPTRPSPRPTARRSCCAGAQGAVDDRLLRRRLVTG